MDQDLKDALKKLEEAKNRQERIERIIILLSGLLIIVIFSIIGINIYSGKEETVSEPEVNIIAKEEKAEEPSKKQPAKPVAEPPKNVKQEKTTSRKETNKKTKEQVSHKSKEKKVKVNQKGQKKPEKIAKAKKPQNKPKKTASVKTTVPSGYYIQAGAFSTRKKAEKLLKKLNLPNALIRKEGNLYKVIIGSFKNRKEAYRFMKQKNIKGFIRKI